MPRVELEEVTSPASAQSVAKSAVFPQNWATLTLNANFTGNPPRNAIGLVLS